MGFLFDRLFDWLSRDANITQQHSGAHFTWSKTTLIVNINGRKQVLDASSGISETLMNQMANHLGMTIPELHDLLNTSRNQQSITFPQMQVPSQSPTRQLQIEPRKGPLKMIQCPQCKHEIAEAEWCWYCGHVFSKTAQTKDSVNDVDKQFLQNDVQQKNSSTEQKQQITDSFKDRLGGL